MANYTPNYQLHQWEPQDPFLRTDFNADLAKIDTTLGTLADAVTGHEEALPLKGNCQIYYASYIGNGGIGYEASTSLTLPVKPLLAIIVHIYPDGVSGGPCGILPSMGNMITIQGGCSATWSKDGKQVSWYSTLGTESAQLNMRGVTYRVYLFADAETL